MTPQRSPAPRRRRALRAWAVSITATVATSYGLDLVATTCGVLLVAATGSTDPTRSVVVTALVASYLGWGVALRVYLYANLDLLEATGTSTSVFSKAAYDLAGRWTPRRRVQRTAATLGYLTTEVAMEVPYYAGAFGAAALSDTLTSDDALVFLTGTNLGAGLYVYGIARATRALLARHPEQTVADPAGPEPTVTAAGRPSRTTLGTRPARQARRRRTCWGSGAPWGARRSRDPPARVAPWPPRAAPRAEGHG